MLREINLKGTKVALDGILRFKKGRQKNPAVIFKSVKIVTDTK
jgi:hypothetical protein